MAKKKPSRAVQVVALIGFILILVNGFFWLTHQEPLPIQEVIEQQIAKQPGLDERRVAQLRIQLAVTDHMQKNGGQPPARLDELVPLYFDSVPEDPLTGKPFAYQVNGMRYTVGATDTAKATSGESGQDQGQPLPVNPAEEGEVLLAMLDQDDFGSDYVYDPTGKRDPFAPFNFAPDLGEMSDRDPLERYGIGQLRLTAVLQGFDEPIALVEDAAGKSHTVAKGTKMGLHGGEIVEILEDRILVLEREVDFTGEETTRTLELILRAGEQTRGKKR